MVTCVLDMHMQGYRSLFFLYFLFLELHDRLILAKRDIKYFLQNIYTQSCHWQKYTTITIKDFPAHYRTFILLGVNQKQKSFYKHALLMGIHVPNLNIFNIKISFDTYGNLDVCFYHKFFRYTLKRGTNTNESYMSKWQIKILHVFYFKDM